jgi:hypothetical protein
MTPIQITPIKIMPIKEMMQEFLATALAVLREIFDEAAYARYLKRCGIVSSRGSYAAFRRESEEMRMRLPKCC